jgi:hypothetical protein
VPGQLGHRREMPDEVLGKLRLPPRSLSSVCLKSRRSKSCASRAKSGRMRHTDLVAGLADPQIAACLHALHADASKDWSVVTLAKAAGASRSVFAQRFCEIVGMPPMQYLLRWRMALEGDDRPRPIDLGSRLRLRISIRQRIQRGVRTACGLPAVTSPRNRSLMGVQTNRTRRPYSSTIATALVQPADALWVFTGKQTIRNPCDGRISKLCSFSR